MKKNIQIRMDTLNPPAFLLIVPGIKAQKKEVEPKQISDMVVRSRKILMIRMLRLENRQGSVYCKFFYLKFPEICKNPYISYLFIYVYIYYMYTKYI